MSQLHPMHNTAIPLRLELACTLAIAATGNGDSVLLDVVRGHGCQEVHMTDCWHAVVTSTRPTKNSRTQPLCGCHFRHASRFQECDFLISRCRFVTSKGFRITASKMAPPRVPNCVAQVRLQSLTELFKALGPLPLYPSQLLGAAYRQGSFVPSSSAARLRSLQQASRACCRSCSILAIPITAA